MMAQAQWWGIIFISENRKERRLLHKIYLAFSKNQEEGMLEYDDAIEYMEEYTDSLHLVFSKYARAII